MAAYASLIGLGLAGAGTVAGAYGAEKATKAQGAAFGAENERQGDYNRQLAAAQSKLLTQESAQNRAREAAQLGMGRETALGDVAKTVASAAGNVARTSPGANQGAISQASTGEAARGANVARLMGQTVGPEQQLQNQDLQAEQYGLNRNRIASAAERSQRLLPLEMEAAGHKGHQVRAVGQLAQVLGTLLSAYGYGAGAAGTSTAAGEGAGVAGGEAATAGGASLAGTAGAAGAGARLGAGAAGAAMTSPQYLAYLQSIYPWMTSADAAGAAAQTR